MKTIFLAVFALFLTLTPQTGGYSCQLDGHQMNATGMTRITDTGKVLYEYRCLNGHTAWVVK